jgi:hypothetical protein
MNAEAMQFVTAVGIFAVLVGLVIAIVRWCKAEPQEDELPEKWQDKKQPAKQCSGSRVLSGGSKRTRRDTSCQEDGFASGMLYNQLMYGGGIVPEQYRQPVDDHQAVSDIGHGSLGHHEPSPPSHSEPSYSEPASHDGGHSYSSGDSYSGHTDSGGSYGGDSGGFSGGDCGGGDGGGCGGD